MPDGYRRSEALEMTVKYPDAADGKQASPQWVRRILKNEPPNFFQSGRGLVSNR
jgi:hypothetical protein